jgi:hypothetical protein
MGTEAEGHKVIETKVCTWCGKSVKEPADTICTSCWLASHRMTEAGLQARAATAVLWPQIETTRKESNNG